MGKRRLSTIFWDNPRIFYYLLYQLKILFHFHISFYFTQMNYHYSELNMSSHFPHIALLDAF